jgi:tetratricopeptide (TPR) repeat protein
MLRDGPKGSGILDDGNGQTTHGKMLTGWREIAAYFGRNESTVKRWAAEKNLPVYRAGEQARRGVLVHAYPSELEAWLRAHKDDSDAGRSEGEPGEASPAGPEPSEPVPRQPGWRRRPMLAAAAAGLIAIAGLGGVAVWQLSGGSQGVVQAQEIPEEARELYLRGTYLWNRRTPEGIAGAIEALTQALEIHPDYAAAHASLAMTYNLARQYSDMSGPDAYAKAEEHARRAVELDPTDAFAQSVLAFVEFHWLWQVEEGLSRFEQAMRLDPKNASTLIWYGSSLIHVNRNADALAVLGRAQELDPDNTTILNMKAQALFYSGREEEGVVLIQELIERDPTHPWSYYALGLLRLGQLDYAGYLENYAKLGDMIGVPRYRAVAEAGLAALAEGGEEAMAQAMAAVDKEFYERGEALAWDIAGHYAMVGNWREAIPWLRISLERHEERLIGVKYNLAFQPIRYRPEYKQLLAEIGLPAD